MLHSCSSRLGCEVMLLQRTDHRPDGKEDAPAQPPQPAVPGRLQQPPSSTGWAEQNILPRSTCDPEKGDKNVGYCLIEMISPNLGVNSSPAWIFVTNSQTTKDSEMLPASHWGQLERNSAWA